MATISVHVLIDEIQKIQVGSNFDQVGALQKIYNRLRLRVEKKLQFGDFPVCKVPPGNSLVLLKSEIDKLCLLGSKSDLIPPTDKAYLKAAYLMANYALGITMEQKVEEKFVESVVSLEAAMFVLLFVQNTMVVNADILKLVQVCQDALITHEDMSSKFSSLKMDTGTPPILISEPKEINLEKMLCKQSSNYEDNPAKWGAFIPLMPGETFNHTKNETGAFWEIDLCGSFELHNIIVTNRADCGLDRLSNFYIMISRDPFPITQDANTSKQIAVWSSFHGAHSLRTKVDPKVVGRYVRIQLVGTNYLHFSRFQIFGFEVK